MKNAGLYDEHLIIDTGLSAKDGSAQIRKWLEQKDHIPTALLAYNEESAITAVSNLREVGLRIPEDVSVISFNDTPLSILTEPPLTSVTAHLEVMGEMAVKMLLDRMIRSICLIRSYCHRHWLSETVSWIYRVRYR